MLVEVLKFIGPDTAWRCM